MILTPNSEEAQALLDLLHDKFGLPKFCTFVQVTVALGDPVKIAVECTPVQKEKLQ